MRRFLVGLCLVVLTGCEVDRDGALGKFPKAETEAIKTLMKDVEKAHPDNPWWGHVKRSVGEGWIADVTFYTDYHTGDPELKEFCEAVVDAVKVDDFLVNFYGFRTHTEQQIDGSTTSEEEHVNLMNGDRDGCSKAFLGRDRHDK